jgi:hypothetical protein
MTIWVHFLIRVHRAPQKYPPIWATRGGDFTSKNKNIFFIFPRADFFKKALFFINYDAPETTAMSDSGGSAVFHRIHKFSAT